MGGGTLVFDEMLQNRLEGITEGFKRVREGEEWDKVIWVLAFEAKGLFGFHFDIIFSPSHTVPHIQGRLLCKTY